MFKTFLYSGVLLAVAFGGPAGIFHFSDFWNDLRSGKIGKSDTAAATDSAMKARTDFYLYRVPEEFYDLTGDPCERRNLIAVPGGALT